VQQAIQGRDFIDISIGLRYGYRYYSVYPLTFSRRCRRLAMQILY
jgi:hypothetical protein